MYVIQIGEASIKVATLSSFFPLSTYAPLTCTPFGASNFKTIKDGDQGQATWLLAEVRRPCSDFNYFLKSP